MKIQPVFTQGDKKQKKDLEIKNLFQGLSV